MGYSILNDPVLFLWEIQAGERQLWAQNKVDYDINKFACLNTAAE